jgi:hypothetical protein
VCLKWHLTHESLVLSNILIEGMEGLSMTNVKLLQQRGAVDEPAPLPTL